jgi:hypothetical protein
MNYWYRNIPIGADRRAMLFPFSAVAIKAGTLDLFASQTRPA